MEARRARSTLSAVHAVPRAGLRPSVEAAAGDPGGGAPAARGLGADRLLGGRQPRGQRCAGRRPRGKGSLGPAGAEHSHDESHRRKVLLDAQTTPKTSTRHHKHE
jgi:hypothetical protein